MGGDDKGIEQDGELALRVRKPTNRWTVVVFLVGMGAWLFHENNPTWFRDLTDPDPPMQDRRVERTEARSGDGPSIGSPPSREISATASRVSYAELKPVLNQVQPFRRQAACRAAPRIPATAYRAVPKDGVQSGILIEDGHEVAKAWGLAIVKLPVEQLWMAVNDEESYPGTLPVTVSEVFRGEPHKNGRLVFQKMALPGPFADRWWIIKKNAGEEMFTASGGALWEACAENATNPALLTGTPAKRHLKDADPVNWTWAGWTLIPLSENLTLVEYFTWTDPGGSLPAGPASRFASGAVKRTMAKIEELARRYKPEDMLRFTRPDGTPLAKPVDVDGVAEPPAEEVEAQAPEQEEPAPEGAPAP